MFGVNVKVNNGVENIDNPFGCKYGVAFINFSTHRWAMV